MINGLRTDGFDLQEQGADENMIERLLQMLVNFLISNQSLELNETFKIYLKILSIDHLNFKRKSNIKDTKRKKSFKRTHVGGNSKLYNYSWAFNIPCCYESQSVLNTFKNKCLLMSCILGLLQNNFFKSNRIDKRFLKAQWINSSSTYKKNVAGKLLSAELVNFLEKTKLSGNGPFEILSTAKIISQTFNCQIFIFDGISNSKKLCFMYPKEYNPSLIPIYLYKPNDNPTHVLFIKNLNSYFRGNFRVCLACKRTFRSTVNVHLCCKLKCCFACRKFYQTPSTFIHEKLVQQIVCTCMIGLHKKLKVKQASLQMNGIYFCRVKL